MDRPEGRPPGAAADRERLRARAVGGASLLLGALALQQAATRSPALVERLYSRGLQPFLGGSLGAATGLVPFSVAEVLAWGITAFLGVAAVRAVLGGRRRLARLAANGLLVAGAAWLSFLLLWGLNYRRQPFASSAGLEVRPARLDELAALGAILIEEANEARHGLPEDAAGVMRLPGGPRATLARTDAGFAAAARRYPVLAGGPSRPKPVAASVVLSWLGITGIYSPFTGEPNVNMTVPDPELPFCASHEVAHARGFAREDEANYLGYLACRAHPDREFRYSGLLAASVYAVNALAALDPPGGERLAARRSPSVGRDLGALAAWAARYRGPAWEAARGVNDAYLRAQGQADGARSYGRMVDLLLAERRAEAAGGPSP